MADRPLLMSAPMVRATLAGIKSQTRRILNPAPRLDHFASEQLEDFELRGFEAVEQPDGRHLVYRPTWRAGDRLWVRETWATWMHAPSLPLGMGGRLSADPGEVAYKATDPEWDHLMADRASLRELAAKLENGRTGNWVVRSPIQMPRLFSRLTLTVTEVRVQRLQDISEDDAQAEGARRHVPVKSSVAGTTIMSDSWFYDENEDGRLYEGNTARDAYEILWGKLNGWKSWDANPWVAAIAFRTTPANIDSLPEQP